MEESTIEAIHRLMSDIEETKHKLRTVKEQIDDTLEQNDEYREIKEEAKQLSAKRAEIKRALQQDKDYQVSASELEELKFQLKDLREILSHHLVTYYNETRTTQIKDPGGEVRQVVISAKIGKPELLIEPQS